MYLALHDNEKVIAVFRKHWLFLAGRIISLATTIVVPYILYYLIVTYTHITITERLSAFFELVYLFMILALWVGFFITYTNFRLDAWILTNDRLMDIDQVALFTRTISTLQLDKVQDITLKKNGLMDEYFGIGKLIVQTAGELEEFVIPNIADPDSVKEKILSAVDAKNHEVKYVRIAENPTPATIVEKQNNDNRNTYHHGQI